MYKNPDEILDEFHTATIIAPSDLKIKSYLGRGRNFFI